MKFSPSDRHTMLNLAEWAISDYITTGRRNRRPDAFPTQGILYSPMGAFVSAYIANDLRGCIGTFSESEPLINNIQQMAVQAATEDRRFKTIKKNELQKLTVEISVLLPREKIGGPDDIIIGKHGIYLINGYKRATLLPQVAVQNNWGPVEFLECCSENKLGMRKNSWKDSELYVYEAILIK